MFLFFSAVRDQEIVDRFMSGCHFWLQQFFYIKKKIEESGKDHVIDVEMSLALYFLFKKK